MNIALVGCMVLMRDVSRIIYDSEHLVFPFWLEQGLHDTPEILRKKLQSKIDEIEVLEGSGKKQLKFDAIVLAYGLCSNAVVGLKCSKLPIVVPRCDDCIALFLGSQQRYLDYFNNDKGIYWYNKSWCENSFVPSKENYENLREQYLEEYGEENADYLLEMETGYTKNYENAYFITNNNLSDTKERAEVKSTADYLGWKYNEVAGDERFIADLLNGNWDERFLVCKPGYRITPDYSGLKIVATKDI